MKIHTETYISLLQVSTALLLLIPSSFAEAKLGGVTTKRSTTQDRNDIRQDPQHEARPLDRRLLPLGDISIGADSCVGRCSCTGSCLPANCLGTCSQNADCYELTQDAKGQQGAVWFQEPFDITGPFRVEANVYVGNKEGGGDGMAFVIQPNSANEYPETGSGGGNLGYRTIPNAFAVEIDTYKDGTFLNDHLELKHTSPWTTIGDRVELLSDIEGMDEEMSFTIEWTAEIGTNNFFVTLGDEGVLAAELASISEYLGDATSAYFGFTAATGARHNLQYVCPISISGGEHPSASPTEAPSSTPSQSPSQSPTTNPTQFPSLTPSMSPTKVPSRTPSTSPSHSPTTSHSPTPQPSVSSPPSTSSQPTAPPRECSFLGTGFCQGSTGGDDGFANYCELDYDSCNVDVATHEQLCEERCRETEECIGFELYHHANSMCDGDVEAVDCFFFSYVGGTENPLVALNWCNYILLDASIGETMEVVVPPGPSVYDGDIVGVVSDDYDNAFTCYQCN